MKDMEITILYITEPDVSFLGSQSSSELLICTLNKHQDLFFHKNYLFIEDLSTVLTFSHALTTTLTPQAGQCYNRLTLDG